MAEAGRIGEASQGAAPDQDRAPLGTGLDATGVLCAVLLGFVGAVFAFKYTAPTPADQSMGLGVAFWLGYTAVLVGLQVWARRSPRWAGRLAPWAAGLLVLVGAAEAVLGPESNGVARAPAVALWLDTLAAGHFPYCTYLHPSALPGLFFLLAPLHALGALAWGPFIGLVLFLALTWRLVRAPADRFLVAAALLGLPSLHYEGLVQSELFLNGTLALGAIALAERARIARGTRWTWGAGLAAGVAAATRMVVPLVLALYLAYAARRAQRRALGAAALAALVFAALTVPFAVWDPVQFFGCGPLVVQGYYLPPAVPLLAGVGALLLGWTAPALRSTIVRTGVLLFALVFFAAAWRVAGIGLDAAVWESGFDVAYFVLPTPWLVLALARRTEVREAA